MTALEKLIKHFERFPGIGSRQAKRFAFHILTLPQGDATEIAELIKSLQGTVTTCPSCFRFHAITYHGGLCTICAEENRDRSKLTVVERDIDIDAIERSGTYDGLYFVLGGTIPLLDTQDAKKLRGGELKRQVTERSAQGLKEIILAFAVNPDGENTARYVEMLLKEIVTGHNIQMSHLGRGLSTGSELEYADPETIRSAFKNRN